MRTPRLSTLAKSKKPLTDKELLGLQKWIDDDWESHDIDRDARDLIQRLIITIVSVENTKTPKKKKKNKSRPFNAADLWD